MKKRYGFVSNSSSSSFVIGKNFMSEEQALSFHFMLDELNEANGEEGYIFETEHYFHGTVSFHNKRLHELLDNLNLTEFAAFDC